MSVAATQRLMRFPNESCPASLPPRAVSGSGSGRPCHSNVFAGASGRTLVRANTIASMHTMNGPGGDSTCPVCRAACFMAMPILNLQGTAGAAGLRLREPPAEPLEPLVERCRSRLLPLGCYRRSCRLRRRSCRCCAAATHAARRTAARALRRVKASVAAGAAAPRMLPSSLTARKRHFSFCCCLLQIQSKRCRMCNG